MEKAVYGYCGLPGRLARMVVRGGSHPEMTRSKAVEHVQGCTCCQNRFEQAGQDPRKLISLSSPRKSTRRRTWWG